MNLRDSPYGSVVVPKTYIFWISNNTKESCIQGRSSVSDIQYFD